MRIFDDAVLRPYFPVQAEHLHDRKLHHVVLVKPAILSRLVFLIGHLNVRQGNVLLLELFHDEELKFVELRAQGVRRPRIIRDNNCDEQRRQHRTSTVRDSGPSSPFS